METCKEMNIPASIERSRSGNGCHVWIFFNQAIPASLARKLGGVLLERTLERRYQLGMDSFDRLFPNQDTLPKGGFGNLIALPLQNTPRKKGNRVFVDENFSPYSDQWLYLDNVKKMNQDDVLFPAAPPDAEKIRHPPGQRLGDDAGWNPHVLYPAALGTGGRHPGSQVRPGHGRRGAPGHHHVLLLLHGRGPDYRIGPGGVVRGGGTADGCRRGHPLVPYTLGFHGLDRRRHDRLHGLHHIPGAPMGQ